MSEVDTHEGSAHYSPPANDVIICLLGALVAAGITWAIFFGLFAGANYGIAQFQITLPQFALDGLDLGAKIIPILGALVAGLVSYRFLIRLP